ncbi:MULTISPECIES: VanZ family protein [Roseateles]|uniref:VanZ family protein n=1 Tax=Pelomonas aquatica TaxID=431058 RepID=A0ABU1Z492_9BURK|nr:MULTISPECIES: VanZ family protein [Roseateles]MDR7295415.1 VanZ family protein [Pelomonas aquatica]
MPDALLNLFIRQRALWRALLALLVAVILWLALSPAPPRTVDTGWDKANHAMAFAALGFVSVWALWPRPRDWAWLALALLAFGGAIEIAQSFLPPREGDWADLLADGAGIALGLLVALPITAMLARSR